MEEGGIPHRHLAAGLGRPRIKAGRNEAKTRIVRSLSKSPPRSWRDLSQLPAPLAWAQPREPTTTPAPVAQPQEPTITPTLIAQPNNHPNTHIDQHWDRDPHPSRREWDPHWERDSPPDPHPLGLGPAPPPTGSGTRTGIGTRTPTRTHRDQDLHPPRHPPRDRDPHPSRRDQDPHWDQEREVKLS
ncbi:PREDICTED: extensin-like [Nipponia nippon]|uniref:extensin-like n=1 Tax=Nipponia nippon TaxID=128390 RepID=UPI0005114521|nr:PREDICTED: extensin-like [Nipponia nippon]